MKKYLLSMVLVALIFTPILSQAFTLAELYAQLAKLQTEIANLQKQQTPVCPFARDLSLGDGPANGRRADVVMMQKWLLEDYLLIPKPTGYFGPVTMAALKHWQKDNKMAVTGKFGFYEREALCGRNDNPTKTVTIDSVSGPTYLTTGQSGTWGLKVTAPTNANINYSVNWGDSGLFPQTSGNSASANQVNQNSTFTHTYNQAGTYTVKFFVSIPTCDNATHGCYEYAEANTSMTVTVGGGSINNNLSIAYPADPANWHDYVGGNYSKTFSVTNFTSGRNYVWTLSSGSLPSGLRLVTPSPICPTFACVPGFFCQPCLAATNQIIISGVPTQAGHFPFVLNVRDNLGNTGSLNVYIDIETNAVACTMDAYRCPSGLYVGRTGPNCQFVCN